MLATYYEKYIGNQYYVSADRHEEFDVDECSVSVMDLDNGFFIEEIECEFCELFHTFCEVLEKYKKKYYGLD